MCSATFRQIKGSLLQRDASAANLRGDDGGRVGSDHQALLISHNHGMRTVRLMICDFLAVTGRASSRIVKVSPSTGKKKMTSMFTTSHTVGRPFLCMRKREVLHATY